METIDINCYDCHLLSTEEIFHLYEKENSIYIFDRIMSMLNKKDDSDLYDRAIRLSRMKTILSNQLSNFYKK